MSRLTSSTGSSLLFVLLLSLILSITVLALGKSILRATVAAKALTSRHKALTEATNGLVSNIQMLDTANSAPLSLPPLPSTKALVLTRAPSPGVFLQTEKHSLWALATVDAILAIRNIAPPQPDWNAVLGLFRPSADSCTDWEDTVSLISASSPALSARTCRQINSVVSSNLFIPGNLHFDSPLTIQQSETELLIAVLGDLSLTEEVTFLPTAENQLEIIVAGNLIIKRLRNASDSQLRVLLHSVSGKISISDWDDMLTDCDNPAARLLLRLESSSGFELGPNRYPTDKTRGCEFSRSAVIWPNIKVLGMFVE